MSKDMTVKKLSAQEFYEATDALKEIKHYVTEAQRNPVMKLNINARNEHQTYKVPDWALLSITAIPQKPKKNNDGFQTW